MLTVTSLMISAVMVVSKLTASWPQPGSAHWESMSLLIVAKLINLLLTIKGWRWGWEQSSAKAMLETIHEHDSQGILFPTLEVVTIQVKAVKTTDTTTTKITKPHRRRSSGQVAPAAVDPFEIVASQTANSHSTHTIEILREQATALNETDVPAIPPPAYSTSDPADLPSVYALGVTQLMTLAAAFRESSDSVTIGCMEFVATCELAGVPDASVIDLFEVADLPLGRAGEDCRVEWRSMLALLAAAMVPGDGVEGFVGASTLFIQGMETVISSHIDVNEVIPAIQYLGETDPNLDSGIIESIITSLVQASESTPKGKQGTITAAHMLASCTICSGMLPPNRPKAHDDSVEPTVLNRSRISWGSDFQLPKYHNDWMVVRGQPRAELKLGVVQIPNYSDRWHGKSSMPPQAPPLKRSSRKIPKDLDLSYLQHIKSRLNTGGKSRKRASNSVSRKKIVVQSDGKIDCWFCSRKGQPAEPSTPAPDHAISPKEGVLLSPPPPPPLDDRNSPENTPDARPLAYTASVDAIARVMTTLAHAPDNVALQDLSHAFDQAEIDSKVIKLVFEVADFEDDERVYAASLYTFVCIVGWSGMAFCSPGCCVV
jgi:hypothetical protein